MLIFHLVVGLVRLDHNLGIGVAEIHNSEFKIISFHFDSIHQQKI